MSKLLLLVLLVAAIVGVVITNLITKNEASIEDHEEVW